MQMVYSICIKLRIVTLSQQRPYTIARLSRENDGIVVSRFGVAKFLKVYQSTDWEA